MTPQHKWEMGQVKKKGPYGHERAKQGFGYTSLRDAHKYSVIGIKRRLDPYFARHPKQDPRFRRHPRLNIVTI